MKKTYTSPKLESIYMQTSDVITASGSKVNNAVSGEGSTYGFDSWGLPM